ncbi:MAG: pentapeptide repeat-containing protein [Alistipes indistinctus]
MREHRQRAATAAAGGRRCRRGGLYADRTFTRLDGAVRDFVQAEFEHCTFTGCDFSYADLSHAFFSGVPVPRMPHGGTRTQCGTPAQSRFRRLPAFGARFRTVREGGLRGIVCSLSGSITARSTN